MSERKTYRIGQIVPSSNTTMETEIPHLMRRHGEIHGVDFTFHSSRMRMKQVTKVELEKMDAESHRCASELADARMDVMGYACLVAIMAMGHGYHRKSREALEVIARRDGCDASVVTSAGALIEGLETLGAKRISIITPYMRPLTDLVVDYIESEGVSVQDSIALEIPDNLAVGRRDPRLLLKDLGRLDTDGVDAVVLSACVQMPSLSAIDDAQHKIGLPVTSAAVCTVAAKLKRLGLPVSIPFGGAVLCGQYAN